MPPYQFWAIEGSWGLPGRVEVAAAAFLGALLKAQLKDFALRHAAGEVFDADATHGADLGNGAAAEA